MVSTRTKGLAIFLLLGFAWIAIFYYPSDNLAVAIGEIASACSANKYATSEDASGNIICSLVNYSQLVGHVGTANETASTPTACTAGQWLSQQTESAGGALTPTCTFNLGSRLTSDTATISGTKSTGLTISLLANTNYLFTSYIYFTTPTSGTTTSNFQIHALAAGAALVVFEATCHHTGVTVLVDDIAGVTNAVTTSVLPTALVNSLSYYCILSGVVTVGANPTTLQLDVVAAATTGNVKTGSFLQAWVAT